MERKWSPGFGLGGALSTRDSPETEQGSLLRRLAGDEEVAPSQRPGTGTAPDRRRECVPHRPGGKVGKGRAVHTADADKGWDRSRGECIGG